MKIEWYDSEKNPPPKTCRFMAYNGLSIYIAEWKENLTGSPPIDGWYRESSFCSCCNGYCGCEVLCWAYLPYPVCIGNE